MGIKESKRNKYLALTSTDEGKDTLKMDEVLGNIIRDIIGSITNNSGNNDVENMKIKYNSDDDLALKKPL